MLKNKIEKFIIWERPCYPGLVFIAGEAVVIPHQREFGRPWAKTYAFWSKGMVRFIWPKKEFLANSRFIAQNFLIDRYLISKLNKFKQLERRLTDWQKKLTRVDFKKLSDRNFLTLIRQFNQVYLNWWGWAQVAEPAAAGLESILREKIKLSHEEFSILTTPTKKSYTMVEEEEIFTLALIYKRTRSISAKRLDRHVKKYFWINNGYDHTYFLDADYFAQRVKEAAAKMSARQISRALAGNQARLSSSQDKIKQLMRQLGVSADIKKVLTLIDWLADFQDKRKATSLKIHFYLDKFIKEVSRRSYITYESARYLIPQEYADAIHDKLFLPSFRQRQKYMGIVYSEQGLKLYVGLVAKKMEEKLLGRIQGSETNEIEGARAMGGKIVGRARLILKKGDINKIKAGEILVTTMTSPDFIAAMKKAAAIVTDEGGLTCHAAIISRELGLPCVIGTKIATRVIKDGDWLEVNANHGIIKIIR
ncbi:MAG: PEP-utilizing enzyme [Patescibacteria group bacterium]